MLCRLPGSGPAGLAYRVIPSHIPSPKHYQSQEFQVLGLQTTQVLYLQFFTAGLDPMSGSCWVVMVMGPVWEWLGVGGQGAWFSLRS